MIDYRLLFLVEERQRGETRQQTGEMWREEGVAQQEITEPVSRLRTRCQREESTSKTRKENGMKDAAGRDRRLDHNRSHLVL